MEKGIEEVVEMSETLTLFGERTGVNYKLPSVELHLNVHALDSASNALLPSCYDEQQHQERKLLFAEHIWPGCLVMADYLVELEETKGGWLRGKSVLELGAGAALPSLVACKLGAEVVVASDFPDDAILSHIATLASRNNIKVVDDKESSELSSGGSMFYVEGHAWGTDCSSLLAHLPSSSGGFDVIFLAECLWKDTYSLHRKLLQSTRSCLSTCSQAVALVSFAHRPCDSHQPHHDLEFFQVAKEEFDFDVQLVKSVKKYADAMDSSELVEVFLYQLVATTAAGK